MATNRGIAIERKFLNEAAQDKFKKARDKTLTDTSNQNSMYLNQLLEQQQLINAQKNLFLNAFGVSLGDMRRQVQQAQRNNLERQAITGLYDYAAQMRDVNLLSQDVDYQINSLLNASMGNAMNIATQQEANKRSQLQASYQALIEAEAEELVETGKAQVDHNKQAMKFLSGALEWAGIGLPLFGIGKGALNLLAKSNYQSGLKKLKEFEGLQ